MSWGFGSGIAGCCGGYAHQRAARSSAIHPGNAIVARPTIVNTADQHFSGCQIGAFCLCLFQRRGPEIAAGNARSGVKVGVESRGEA